MTPDYFAIYSPSRGWFRGARFWRWTRFMSFAAWHDRPDVMNAIIERRLPFLSRYQMPSDCLLLRVGQDKQNEFAEVSDNTQTLIDLLKQRDAVGLKKYGVSLDRTDLRPEEWIQHTIEELLDGAAYLQGLKKSLTE